MELVTAALFLSATFAIAGISRAVWLFLKARKAYTRRQNAKRKIAERTYFPKI